KDWKIKIFGEGDLALEKHLKKLITDLKLEDRIQLKGATGFLSREMGSAKIYAMTSATECFPMVLLEAQAQGMAVVSYDCPNGPRNIVDDQLNGVLTEGQNIPKCAAPVSGTIKDAEKWQPISRHAVLNAEKFTPNNI